MKKFAIFSVVMIIGAGVALATTLTVPFFRDGATPARTTRGFIGIKDTSGSDQVITVVYSSLDASLEPEDQTVTFALSAFEGVQWQPVEDLATEGSGQIIPNMDIGGKIVGAATITGSGIHGMYREIDITNSGAFGHTIGPFF